MPSNVDRRARRLGAPNRMRLAAATLALVLVSTACGDDDDGGADAAPSPSITADGAVTGGEAEPIDDDVAADEADGEAAAPPPQPGADRDVYGWYLGVPIRPNAITPPAYGGEGPEAPTDDVPDLTVYLVGPVDEGSPVGPPREIPGPDGGTVALPPHQQTHDRVVSPDEPHDAIGTFVVAGPEATDETVRLAEEVPDSVAGAPLATAVRMGAVWADLSNHHAIEWGLDAGLLETVPFEYGGLMWTEFVDERPISLACEPAPVPPPREAEGPTGAPPGEEYVVYGYFAGLPMRPTAILPAAYGGPGPDGPSDDVPDVTVYLAAPFDPEAPSAPPREGIPTPDGPRNLPTHTQVHDRLVPSDRPHDAMGVFVVAGPEATDDTVRLGDEVENSVAGAPLAAEIRMGGVWVGLDNHLAIEHGVAAGVLELVPFEFGGLMWQSFDVDGFWLDCG
jgi:hypothetical protein